MKKIKIYLIGQKYEVELEDGFYEFIKDDIDKLNNSENQIKDLLNLLLSSKYQNYENERKIANLIQTIEII